MGRGPRSAEDLGAGRLLLADELNQDQKGIEVLGELVAGCRN